MSERRALVVEDHEILRKVLRISLEGGGFAVTEAATGGEALAALARDQLELIVMDLGLPDTDGVELLGQIRSSPAGAGIPVVALSGADESLERARASGHELAECLVKPVSPDQLLAVAERCAAPASSPPEGAGPRPPGH